MRKLRDRAKLRPMSFVNLAPAALGNFCDCAKKPVRLCKKMRERPQIRLRSCESEAQRRVRNLRDFAKNCANLRKTARSCGNSARVALGICAIARKNCANARLTVRACGNPVPVVRKFGPGRVNLRDCAKTMCEFARNCAIARKFGPGRATTWPRSR